MGIKNAVEERIRNLCKERKLSVTELARMSGVAPSTIYSLLNKDRKDVGIVLLKKICDGLEIDLFSFFRDSVFNTLEQEIK